MAGERTHFDESRAAIYVVLRLAACPLGQSFSPRGRKQKENAEKRRAQRVRPSASGRGVRRWNRFGCGTPDVVSRWLPSLLCALRSFALAHRQSGYSLSDCIPVAPDAVSLGTAVIPPVPCTLGIGRRASNNPFASRAMPAAHDSAGGAGNREHLRGKSGKRQP